MKFSGLSTLLFYVFFFQSLIFLSGCSDQEERPSPEKFVSKPVAIHGGVYRAPLRSNPTTLDPAYLQDIYGITLAHQIFDGLVRFDPSLTIQPALAETWQIKDGGKIYRFILKNAFFHNQTPVSSEDVVFSISRLLRAEPAPVILPHLLKITGASEYRAGTRPTVQGLTIETDKIFTVHLKTPHVPFLTAMGMYQAAIVSKKEALRLGDDFSKHPVGTGPFRFISWEKGKSIRLKRFNNYFGQSALLDEIRYKIYPGGQDPLVLLDFQEGRLEEMEVYGDVKETLVNTPGLQWFHRPSLSLFFYGMNVSHPNLSDPALRSALSLAIDRRTFVSQVYKGQFEVAQTILPPGMPGYNPKNRITADSPDNIQKQPGLSAGGDKSNPGKIEIVSALKTPRVAQEMALIKQYWSKIGISAVVKYITDWKDFKAYIKSDSVQVYRYVWFADMPDPDSFLYSLFASDSTTNFMKFNEPAVDRMLLDARGIIDPIKRAKTYQKIEARIMELTPLIPLFHMNVDRVYQPYVKSAKISALGAHTMPLNRIWLDTSLNNKD